MTAVMSYMVRGAESWLYTVQEPAWLGLCVGEVMGGFRGDTRVKGGTGGNTS